MLLLLYYIEDYVHPLPLLSQQPSPGRHLSWTLQQSSLLGSLSFHSPQHVLHKQLAIFLELTFHHFTLLLQTVQWVFNVFKQI